MMKLWVGSWKERFLWSVTSTNWDVLGGSVVKNPPANAGDASLIPGSGRHPGGGNGNPLQYSYLGNPMGRGAWWATVCGVTKSQMWLCKWGHPSTTVSFGIKCWAIGDKVSCRTKVSSLQDLMPDDFRTWCNKIIEIKCTINVMCLNHFKTTPSLPPLFLPTPHHLVPGKIVFHKTAP